MTCVSSWLILLPTNSVPQRSLVLSCKISAQIVDWGNQQLTWFRTRFVVTVIQFPLSIHTQRQNIAQGKHIMLQLVVIITVSSRDFSPRLKWLATFCVWLPMSPRHRWSPVGTSNEHCWGVLSRVEYWVFPHQGNCCSSHLMTWTVFLHAYPSYAILCSFRIFWSNLGETMRRPGHRSV